MKSLRDFILILLCTFAIAAGCSYASWNIEQQAASNGAGKPAKDGIASDTADTNLLLQGIKGKRLDFQASYSDWSPSLEDLKNDSDKIVYGIVKNQVQFSPVSVESTLSVKKNIKGKNFNTIKIYQLGTLGNPEVLQMGGEYVLCLGSQGEPDENKYFIKSGIQGMFLKDDDKIIAYDDLMRNEILKLTGSSGKTSNSQFDLLMKFLSK